MLQNANEAYRWFFQHLESVEMQNPYPTGIFCADKKKKYLVMFKREYYQNFSHHFPHVKKDDGSAYGWGQIMSDSLLTIAVHNGTDELVFITPDKKAYACAPMLFRRFVDKHNTRVPHIQGEVALPLQYFERRFPEESP